MTALPLDSRITVERVDGSAGPRLWITIERRRSRCFSVSLDEAAQLAAGLARELPPVTVKRIEARDGAR
jgi:hypothetical protein